MKLYCVASIVKSDRVYPFHTAMFHGKIDRIKRYGESHFLGQETDEPMNVIRNGRQIPEVFEPRVGCNLVVSEAIRLAIGPLPGLVLRPVHFSKLVDYPYQAGDFTWVEALRAMGPPVYTLDDGFSQFHPERLLDILEDIAELHASAGAYYELIVADQADLAPLYPGRTAVRLRPNDITGEVILDASGDLIRDHPITWNTCYFFDETSFAIVGPHLDNDYFVVVETEIPG
jgi:hypothetical protein